MIDSRSAIQYRQLRAPRQHGAVLVDPPLETAPQLLALAESTRQEYDYDFHGRSFADLASQARRELLDAAYAYTAAYRDPPPRPAASAERILLTGHQPELYHPGVWFKNFALSAIARRCDAHAVHLLIDNDTVGSAEIRVPQGTTTAPRVGRVSLDKPTAEMPHEERWIRDRDTFAAFGPTVRRRIASLIDEPLVDQLWPLAVDASRQTDNLGRALSQARHRLEAEWGLSTCELPLSEVCRGEPFHWFVTHLLAQLPRFREIHNASLVEYRRVHRLRSRTHPVPELARHDDWLEAPFWIWTADEPQRGRLHVRARGPALELSDLRRRFGTLTVSAEGVANKAVGQLADLQAAGVRLRPRALITTMFARLLLGDVFLHGIGGAKYDQLTDRIMERFFQLRPPPFFVLTATALLPIDRPRVSRDDLRRVDWLLRELRFNPQRHVAENEGTRPLVAAKLRCLDHESASGDRRARHREIVRVNEALQPFVEPQRVQLVEDRQRCVMQLRHETILASREYSFCLFPEDVLRPFLLDI